MRSSWRTVSWFWLTTSRSSRLRWLKAPCLPSVCGSVWSSWSATWSLWATAWWRRSTRSAGRRRPAHHCLLLTIKGENYKAERWSEAGVVLSHSLNETNESLCAAVTSFSSPHYSAQDKQIENERVDLSNILFFTDWLLSTMFCKSIYWASAGYFVTAQVQSTVSTWYLQHTDGDCSCLCELTLQLVI